MRAHLYLTILFILAAMWSCSGLLVTKNMKKPRVTNLDMYADIGEKLSAFHGMTPDNLPPVVCIPGVGGSQLMAQLQKNERGHWFCEKSADWFMIWLQLYELVPGPILQCWSANMELAYNASTGQFTNASGVKIKPNYEGQNTTQGFEYVDPNAQSESIYFAAVVASLVKIGYVRGQNLLGAPYDWRLSPYYLPGYFSNLKSMIEDAYAVNNSKVAIVAHSMGNLFFLSFLQTVSQEWKDTYILNYVAASPPWVGAVAAVQSLTAGYDFSIPYLPPSSAKVVQRTFASNYFLMPHPEFFGDTVLIQTPAKNYTANDYEELLTDIGISQYYDVWKLSYNTANPYQPPGVDTFCLYGYDVTTVQAESYTNNKFSNPTLINGNGDGTVPIQSLTFCQNWQNITDKQLVIKGYQGQEHVNLMIYPPFVADVLSAIFNGTIVD